MDDARTDTPLVLLVDDQEWTARSLESILRPEGITVVKAYTARQALDLAGRVEVDAALVAGGLPDMSGTEAVRALRALPNVGHATPILVTSAGGKQRAEKLEALAAGAWDVMNHPIDAGELVLRISAFIRAKQESDRRAAGVMTDTRTGFYNTRGLLRRAKETRAEARRAERPLACVALGASLLDADGPDAGAWPEESELVEALRAITRESDTIARLPSGDFVVLAPGADDQGALRLVTRVLEFLIEAKSRPERAPAISRLLASLRAGYYAPPMEDVPEAETLLARATTALRRAQAEDESAGFMVRGFVDA